MSDREERLGEFAKALSDCIDSIRSEREKVVKFDPSRAPRSNRQPPLSDAELIDLRTMLREFRELHLDFDKICGGCPLAARVLSDR